jgi:UDP-3-O-[3-hydroxymyristoyl] glucosamine N-acyltransferase
MVTIENIVNTIGMNWEMKPGLSKSAETFVPLNEVSSGKIAFCSGMLNGDPGGIVICKECGDVVKTTCITVNNPRLAFIRVMGRYCKPALPRITQGENVIIEKGAVIGAEGFSFERTPQGSLERFPHIGGVYIGDFVRIGSNTLVERGTFNDTIILSGTQIDGLVMIGHNSIIGKDCVIVCGAMICGSVKVGDRTWIGAGAVIRDGVTIGRDCCIGMGAVVVKDVPNNTMVMGVPAHAV